MVNKSGRARPRGRSHQAASQDRRIRKVTLVTYPPRRTIWDYVWSRSDDSAELDALLSRALLGEKARALAGHLPIRAFFHGAFSPAYSAPRRRLTLIGGAEHTVIRLPHGNHERQSRGSQNWPGDTGNYAGIGFAV